MKLENLSSIGSPELDSSMFRLCHNTNGHPAVNKAPRCFPSLTSCSVNEKKHCKSKISVFHLSAGGVVIKLPDAMQGTLSYNACSYEVLLSSILHVL